MMELLLSSPIIIVALFLLTAIVGVFIFELKAKRGKEEQKPPLPPTSIPFTKNVEPKKIRKPIIIASVALFLLLLLSIPAAVILIQQRQAVLKRAEEIPPSPTTQPVLATSTPLPLPSPSPTKSPVSPTSKNKPPVCLDLTASPQSGRSPLTVTFLARARDEDGQITSFLFVFGDDTTQRIDKALKADKEASQSSEHVYNQPGSYQASVTVLDNDVLFSPTTSDCQVAVDVLTATGRTSDTGTETTSTDNTLLAQSPVATPTTAPVENTGIGGIGGNTESSPTATLAATPTSQGEIAPEIPESGYPLPTILLTTGGLILLVISTLLVI